jgi:hypothetical protein
MFDEKTVLSKLRLAIGDPPTQGAGCVYDDTLGMEFEDALERLFRELECRIETQPTVIQLRENERRYPMPPDMVRPITVRLGLTEDDGIVNLIPDSVYRWGRDSVPWETAESGVPGRFAIQSRNIILYPPPDDTSVSTYPYASVLYIASSPKMQAQGVQGTTDNDLLTAIYDAALQLDGARTPKDDADGKAIAKRMARNQGLYSRHLHFSKRDWESPLPLRQSQMSIGGRWAQISR